MFNSVTILVTIRRPPRTCNFLERLFSLSLGSSSFLGQPLCHIHTTKFTTKYKKKFTGMTSIVMCLFCRNILLRYTSSVDAQITKLKIYITLKVFYLPLIDALFVILCGVTGFRAQYTPSLLYFIIYLVG